MQACQWLSNSGGEPRSSEKDPMCRQPFEWTKSQHYEVCNYMWSCCAHVSSAVIVKLLESPSFALLWAIKRAVTMPREWSRASDESSWHERNGKRRRRRRRHDRAAADAAGRRQRRRNCSRGENDEMMSIDGCWRQPREPGHAMSAFFPRQVHLDIAQGLSARVTRRCWRRLRRRILVVVAAGPTV